jgi:hypothetical protein
MKAPTSSNKPRVLPPRGTHLCRCVQVIDLGTQHFQPGDDGSRKLYLAFETCMVHHVFDEKKGPEPFMVQHEFAYYMGRGAKKTKLRKFLESWFGKSFPSDEAAAEFDFEKLLGRPVMLTIGHAPKNDGSMKAVITDQFLPEAGTQVPPAKNPLVCYEITMKEEGTFKQLPAFLQKKLREADEFGGRSGGTNDESYESATPVNQAGGKVPNDGAAFPVDEEVEQPPF